MPSPVQDAQAQKMMQLLASGGGAPAPGGGGAPVGSLASPTSMALKSASDQLDGANPQGLLSVIQQMSTDLAQMYLMAAMRLPDAAKDIATAREALARVAKVAQKAAQTQAAVAPIVNNAGIGPMNNPPSGGQPDIAALLGMSQ